MKFYLQQQITLLHVCSACGVSLSWVQALSLVPQALSLVPQAQALLELPQSLARILLKHKFKHFNNVLSFTTQAHSLFC